MKMEIYEADGLISQISEEMSAKGSGGHPAAAPVSRLAHPATAPVSRPAHPTAAPVSRLAVRALLYEVCTTPKPGLVDRANSGSHRDMDIYTFVDSALALGPYFEECVRIGRETALLPAPETFRRLRPAGIRAEKDMFAATGGVNTHKGAIFSVGIVCAAAGRLEKSRRDSSGTAGRRHGDDDVAAVQAGADWQSATQAGVDVAAAVQAGADGQTAIRAGTDAAAPYTTAILTQCADITRGLTASDFAGLTPETAVTVGQRLYLRYGITGIRGQAEAGFPAVSQTGLPVLRGGLARGLSINDAGCAALLALMCAATDTNLIARSSLAIQQRITVEIGRMLAADPYPSIGTLERLDRKFISLNLSPGGSADLLAICYLLHFLETI